MFAYSSMRILVQRMKTHDDQQVMNKHTSIYPTESELAAVQNAVQVVEGALKEVSSAIHEQEMKVYTASISNQLVMLSFLLLSKCRS